MTGSATPIPELVPVAPGDRILLLDVLRGMALFGVLWSNLNDWYIAVDPASRLDHVLAWMQTWLIESRFYSLLGFLFGMGFAIQLSRADERGVDVRSLFYRRMAALLVIGIAHGMLIWRGDVLTTYALLGFILVIYRRLPPRQLLAAAAATYFAVPYAVRASLVLLNLQFAPRSNEPNPIYAHGTWAEIVAQGARDYLYWYGRWPFFVFPAFLVLFVLGMWSVRVDLMNRLMKRRKSLVLLLIAAVAGTLLGILMDSRLAAWWPSWDRVHTAPPAARDVLLSVWTIRPMIADAALHLATWSSAAGYALLFALLVSSRWCARRLQPLAAVGRMSLTTYLTQSLISVTLFYGYGFGWYGRVGYRGMLVVAVVVFSAQMAASAVWLKRYRFGPVEWLWRSAAYGKWQRMRAESLPALAAAPSLN